MKKVVCVVGTRPEVVKLAPVVLALKRHPEVNVRLLASGQHRGLLDQALADFALKADLDLDLMRADQRLADLTAGAIVGLTAALATERPDYVLAQGDTTTVLCAALAAYYQHIPFGHVEAGLRTGDPYAPFPEEKNRVLVSHLADLHFAPTRAARENLRREGIAEASIHVTGNTVIDALATIASAEQPLPCRPPTDRFVLVTAHRRENFGEPLIRICEGLRELVERNADMSAVIPVHPNPHVRSTVQERLGGHPRIVLIEPAGYVEFVALMKASYLIVTDSGGVQEEAPTFGKPVLVLRDQTERPEAVAAGKAVLIGTRREALVTAVEELWHSESAYARFQLGPNPYGDGRAAERIVHALADRLGIGRPPFVTPLPDWPPPADDAPGPP
jgi:UDP-N-acetylglucosamine 2-epimerase (non-hydrolysing)